MLTHKSTPTHGCRFYDTPHGRVYGVPAPAPVSEHPDAEYWRRAAAWLRWVWPAWGVGCLLAIVVLVSR